jgi:hypothetical protein
MKSSNYVIYLKKRMDMGKCTSCILYIKQNPTTTYKETTSFAFLLESSTTSQSIPNNIIYSPHPPSPPFPKKKKKKMVINRVLDLICRVFLVLVLRKFCQNNSIFVETCILLFLFKTPA